MVREVVLNDMWIGEGKEERIIRIISDGDYNEDVIEESVDDLMKFFFNSVSAGFLDALTDRLNNRRGRSRAYNP